MENSSKALLIAATVLIVILIIAFSMRIFNSTDDVSQTSREVGKTLENQTGKATTSAISELITATPNSYNSKEEINFILYLGKGTSYSEKFKAEKNMTWEDFIKSSYNTRNYKLSGQTVICEIDGWNYVVRKKSNELIQKGDMKIIENEMYVLTSI